LKVKREAGPRLESLDVFRGLTVAGMILVSTPGTWSAVYWPLEHAAWDGWTPTDLVFPFFIFAMGAAVPLALARHRNAPRRLTGRVFLRALRLVLLGLLLNAIETPPPLTWATFRFPGVLQRIALVYLAMAVLTRRHQPRLWAGAAVTLLLGYWAAMTFVPVPGFGAGALTPEGNLAAYVDRTLFGLHLAPGPWDPEGLMSTLPAIATALCGALAGEWLVQPTPTGRRTASLWAAGAALTVLGLLLDRVFPINKNLWTSSFAVLTAGIAAQVLALCHWLLDVHHWRGWAVPFKAFGQNALAAYVLSIGLDTLLDRWAPWQPEVSVKWDLYQHAFASWAERCCAAETASLLYAVVYVGFWGLVMIELQRRRVFIAV
jgi:predicted acyltransferase